MKKGLLLVTMVLFLSQTAFAQTNTSQMSGFRRNVATIIFAGLGGAVLGLSTLSFYGEPEDHVSNIWMGLGVGLIAGTAYVTTRDTNYSQLEIPTNPHQLQKHKNAPQIFAYHWDF